MIYYDILHLNMIQPSRRFRRLAKPGTHEAGGPAGPPAAHACGGPAYNDDDDDDDDYYYYY